MRVSIHTTFAVAVFALPLQAGAVQSETVDQLLQMAKTALDQGERAQALDLATKAIDLEPKNPKTHLFRGNLQAILGRHAEAVADFDKVLTLDPKLADAYNQRGSEHFKLGHISASLADFDKYLELKPDQAAGHWMRGITCYYAGRFDEGRKQFEGYEKVDTDDVENAVWQFLCNARVVGIDKARAAMLKIGNDKRVPMMKVYALFRGEAKPEDVLKAAEEGKPSAAQLQKRLFYAHLYLGLYFEAVGDKKAAREHIRKAAEEFPDSQYMGDVARVHWQLLRQQEKGK